jgi:hypothetical protein
MAEVQKIGRVTFIRKHDIKVLNAAGSRGSKEPGVAAFVKRTLDDAFYPRISSFLAAAEPHRRDLRILPP